LYLLLRDTDVQEKSRGSLVNTETKLRAGR